MRWHRIPASIVIAIATVAVAALGAWLPGESDAGNKGKRLKVGAWVPYWDQDAGSRSLRRERGVVGSASPFWFNAVDATTIQAHPGAGDGGVLSRLNRSGFEVTPTITSTMGAKKAIRELSPAKRRRKHVRKVLRIARGYDGIDFNYEHPALTTSKKRAQRVRRVLSQTFEEACAALRKRKLVCSVTVMPRTSQKPEVWRGKLLPWVYDYDRIGVAANRVRVMAYDQHAPGTPPGPIAPKPWVERIARFSAKHVPPKRLELGTPLYGRDWGPGGNVGTLTWRGAESLRKQVGAKRRFSRKQGAPYFTYGGGHEVWYSDGRSVATRAAIARRHGFRGIYLWAPGAEDPTTWKKLKKLRR